jgi:rare lipoprotein A
MKVTVPAKTPVSPARRWQVFALSTVLLVVLCSSGCATKTVSGPTTVRNRDVPARDTRKAYNRPYTVKGQRYYPMASAKGYAEHGIASWYGWESGNRTAMGEDFDPSRLTAAHRTLPLPTTVHVTNLDNNHSVVVVVNDRGPFVEGRLIDLSDGAARKIGMRHTGTARVKVVAIPTD